ncbi:MAG: tRNA (adenosine(37)-N6)-threonylcarbamoyltransferase complex ATPase subunit type 1 TsaE [Bacteroidales bacterium]|nr:tRNA (adenosine(37)-N6)-threonylcarbamoyltransferase complex ATPase subunit type 1 TsaE [Bacteroidales bacterium]
MQTITCESTENLPAVAESLLRAHAGKRIFALHAEMGTGKTTFMQAVCAVLGSADHATSPTFAIVNEYRLPQDETLYHLDCYRLKNLREAEEIGVEEYLYSGAYCFIEWPENIEELLPEDCVHVHIRTETPYAGGNRYFSF